MLLSKLAFLNNSFLSSIKWNKNTMILLTILCTTREKTTSTFVCNIDINRTKSNRAATRLGYIITNLSQLPPSTVINSNYGQLKKRYELWNTDCVNLSLCSSLMRVPVVLIFLLFSGCFCAPAKNQDVTEFTCIVIML